MTAVAWSGLAWSWLAWSGLGCTGESDLEASLGARGLEACDAIELPNLAIVCRIDAAAEAAGLGDDLEAREACAAVPEGLWREECHFRAGEELGRRGYPDLALRHCAEAGDFGPNCLTHTAWGLKIGRDLRSDAPEVVLPAMDELLSVVESSLDGADPRLRAEAEDGLISRAWFNVYVGSGLADPAAARAVTGAQAPYARTAFAIEAVRLMAWSDYTDAEARLLDIWEGRSPAPTGPSLSEAQRKGRHAGPVKPRAVEELPHIGTFGGGARLVDPDPQVDLAVALLEALFFREATPPAVFLPFISDERAAVRWTATKLYALEADAAALELEDPLLLAYVEAAGRERRAKFRRPIKEP